MRTRIILLGDGKTPRKALKPGLDGADIAVQHHRFDPGISQERQQKGEPDRIPGAQELAHLTA